MKLKRNQQGPKMVSVRSRVCPRTNFRTREPDFHGYLFHQKLPGQEDSIKLIFSVSTGSANNEEVTQFNPHLPVMKYLHDDEITCCFSIPVSTMFAYIYIDSEKDIEQHAK